MWWSNQFASQGVRWCNSGISLCLACSVRYCRLVGMSKVCVRVCIRDILKPQCSNLQLPSFQYIFTSHLHCCHLHSTSADLKRPTQKQVPAQVCIRVTFSSLKVSNVISLPACPCACVCSCQFIVRDDDDCDRKYAEFTSCLDPDRLLDWEDVQHVVSTIPASLSVKCTRTAKSKTSCAVSAQFYRFRLLGV